MLRLWIVQEKKSSRKKTQKIIGETLTDHIHEIQFELIFLSIRIVLLHRFLFNL